MRDRITISAEHGLYEKLKKLSEITRVPASRLFDEAIEDLLIKHDFKTKVANFEKQQKDKEKYF